MSEGLAVIAANSAGAPEVVGEAGLLVKPRDPADIARALSELAERPALIAEYGQRARERVAAHFDWHHLAERYTELYAELIARRAGYPELGIQGVGSGSHGS